VTHPVQCHGGNAWLAEDFAGAFPTRRSLMSRSPLTRAVAVACLAGVAVTHVLDLPDKLAEAHYMAALFCCLILASVILAAALLVDRHTDLALALAGILSAMTICGFVLSRTVGLPQIEDHVGQWGDPIGIASLVFELGLVWLAVHVARARQVVVPEGSHAV
jgi:hypothetical protein